MHQDYTVMYPDFWSGYKEFWYSITKEEQAELIKFLQHVNGDALPGGMQKKYWHISGAQVLPSKISVFMSELLNKAKGF